jgi:hypothetical protein
LDPKMSIILMDASFFSMRRNGCLINKGKRKEKEWVLTITMTNSFNFQKISYECSSYEWEEQQWKSIFKHYQS